VWSVGDKPRLLTPAVHYSQYNGNCRCIGITPDGTTIITGHLNGCVRFWSFEKDVLFEQNPIVLSPLLDRQWADLSADGRFAAIMHEDSRMHIWNLADFTTQAFEKNMKPVRFAPDGASFASNPKSRVVIAASADPLGKSLREFTDLHAAGCFSPDGKWLVTTSSTDTAMWNISGASSKEFSRFTGISAVRWQFTPDSRFLIVVKPEAGTDQGAVRVWAVAKNGLVFRQETTVACTHFTLSPDGKTALFCKPNGVLLFCDLEDGVMKPRREDRFNATWADYSPDGQVLLLGVSDGLKIINATTCEVLRDIPLRGLPLAGRFHPDGKHVFVSNVDRTLYVLRLTLDADRKAAETVIALGGSVRVNGKTADIKDVANLPKEPFRLTEVWLQDVAKVTDTDAAVFKGCEHLTSLVLRGTQVTNASVTELRCRNLLYLSLGHTQITDAVLVHVPQFKKLARLGLSGTEITDAGLVPLKGCKKLVQLDVNTTKLTDAGIETLKEIKGLVYVNLTHTAVTMKGIDELRKALPKCHIVWDGGTIEPKK
jgi:WD40 repeat protein